MSSATVHVNNITFGFTCTFWTANYSVPMLADIIDDASFPYTKVGITTELITTREVAKICAGARVLSVLKN
jgi:hypothetical protein